RLLARRRHDATREASERVMQLPDNLPVAIDALFQTAEPLSQDLRLRMKISHKNNMRRRKSDPVRWLSRIRLRHLRSVVGLQVPGRWQRGLRPNWDRVSTRDHWSVGPLANPAHCDPIDKDRHTSWPGSPRPEQTPDLSQPLARTSAAQTPCFDESTFGKACARADKIHTLEHSSWMA